MSRIQARAGFFVGLCLSACAAADRAVVEDTLERAEAVYERALALEHGWSVTRPLMDDVRAALAAGDEAAALVAAERALLTAEKSLEQALAEAEAWRDRVIGR